MSVIFIFAVAGIANSTCSKQASNLFGPFKNSALTECELG